MESKQRASLALDFDDDSRLTTVARGCQREAPDAVQSGVEEACGSDNDDDDDEEEDEESEEQSEAGVIKAEAFSTRSGGKAGSSTPSVRSAESRGGVTRGSAKAQAAAKKKEAAASLQCKGCFRLFRSDEMYPQTNFCRACKKAYDAIAKLASRQGQEAWWKTTREAPKSLKKILARYKRVCPDMNVGRGRKRTVGFSLVKYMEEVSAKTKNR